MSFLKMLIKGSAGTAAEENEKLLDPKWRKGPRSQFNRLFDLDLDHDVLDGQGGVYILWHKGVQPAWLYVGYAPSLSVALNAAKNNETFREYDIRGGLYYTWSTVLEDYRRGVALYLRDVLEPVIHELPGEEIPEEYESGGFIEPIPVVLPR